MPAKVTFALRGAPGIGKSTVATLLAAQLRDINVIEVDELRARQTQGDWSDRDFYDQCLGEAEILCQMDTGRTGLLVDVLGGNRWPELSQHWIAAGYQGICISLVAEDHVLADRHRSRFKGWGDTHTVQAINREIRNSRWPDELILDSSKQVALETAARVLDVIRMNRAVPIRSNATFTVIDLTSSPVACLTATRDRLELLRSRTLPSILRQDRKPDVCVFVNDGPRDHRFHIESLVDQLGKGFVTLQNDRSPGAAGAWNTGLEYLKRSGFSGFVAVLDDDDEWDRDHLSLNLATAARSVSNLCVSGLRLWRSGRIVDRPLIDSLCGSDFLVGNPGWQGSNTFIDLELLLSVGGFDEQLDGMHDRDIAIRVLASGRARPALVPRFTATWHIGTEGALSSRGSPRKLDSLRRFLKRYGSLMTHAQRDQFFERAEQLFAFARSVIVQGI